jgi:hypothetical protein
LINKFWGKKAQHYLLGSIDYLRNETQTHCVDEFQDVKGRLFKNTYPLS